MRKKSCKYISWSEERQSNASNRGRRQD